MTDIEPISYVALDIIDEKMADPGFGYITQWEVMQLTAGVRARDAKIEWLLDTVDGLKSDLHNAVETAITRGAVDWGKLNYPGFPETVLPQSTTPKPIEDE